MPRHQKETLPPSPEQKEVIGIVGGMGPRAHIQLERYMLEAAEALLQACADQDFPQWILSSIPQTPDRTASMRGQGPDPTDLLTESLRKLRTHLDEKARVVRGADFAVVACISAHKFIGEAAGKVGIPILNMVTESAAAISACWPGATVGLLATSGTLEDGFLHEAFRRSGLVPVSPVDLADGSNVQQELVMETIYGKPAGNGRHDGGIKGQGILVTHIEALCEAARHLIELGNAEVIFAGCTEIGLALSEDTICGVPLVDPMKIAAEAAVRRAYGLELNH